MFGLNAHAKQQTNKLDHDTRTCSKPLCTFIYTLYTLVTTQLGS